MADKHFTPQNSLIPRNTLLQNGFAHFAPQLTLLLNTIYIYSSAHFTEVRFASLLSRWIHYYDSNKSTRLETGKLHIWALSSLAHFAP